MLIWLGYNSKFQSYTIDKRYPIETDTATSFRYDLSTKAEAKHIAVAHFESHFLQLPKRCGENASDRIKVPH